MVDLARLPQSKYLPTLWSSSMTFLALLGLSNKPFLRVALDDLGVDMSVSP